MVDIKALLSIITTTGSPPVLVSFHWIHSGHQLGSNQRRNAPGLVGTSTFPALVGSQKIHLSPHCQVTPAEWAWHTAAKACNGSTGRIFGGSQHTR